MLVVGHQVSGVIQIKRVMVIVKAFILLFSQMAPYSLCSSLLSPLVAFTCFIP
ncbi:hypothetical protein J4Q44_G00038530 [Coregonus suidteri]|uniref:Uncharacterized protein n=1 Tax=Coregonus suidteri TaxID=861788 RepID=A0AAN8NC79_9TELE